jgi:type IV pilus assembly protein PilV
MAHLSARRQRGVSLIEVLVAIVIFSVGMLGIAFMQIKGAQYTKQSGSRTVAVLQARSLAEAMRANPAGVWGVSSPDQIAAKNGDLSGSYYVYDGTSKPDPATCSDTACKQAKQDLLDWLKQLGAGVAAPVGSDGKTANAAALGTVTKDTKTGTLIIASSWNGLIRDTSGASSNDSYSFSFQP